MKYGDHDLPPVVDREILQLVASIPTLLDDESVTRTVMRRACAACGALAGGLLVMSRDDEPLKFVGAVGPIGRSSGLARAVSAISDKQSSAAHIVDVVRSIGIAWPPAHPQRLQDPDHAYELSVVPLLDVTGIPWGFALFVSDTVDAADRALTVTEPILDVFGLWSWVRYARAMRMRAGEDGFGLPDLFRVDRINARLLHDANGSLASAAMQNELLDIAGTSADELLKAQNRSRESLRRTGNALALIEEVIINWYAATPLADPVKCAVIAKMYMRDLEVSGAVTVQMMAEGALPKVAIPAPGAVVTMAYIQAMRYFFVAHIPASELQRGSATVYVDFDTPGDCPGMVCLCVSLVNPPPSAFDSVNNPPHSLAVRRKLLHAIVDIMGGRVRVSRDGDTLQMHVLLPIR